MKNFKLTGISGSYIFFIQPTDTPQVGVLEIKNEIEPAIRMEVLRAELVLLKDVIAWVKNTKVSTIHRVNIKSEPTEEFSNINETLFGVGNISFSHFDILAGFHDILKEKNITLRFLMYYRFLEVAKRRKGVNTVDGLFKILKIPVQYLPDKRNSKKEISHITFMRNKIHATNSSYAFPQKDIIQCDGEMNFACRSVIEKLASDKSFHFPQQHRLKRNGFIGNK